MKVRYARINEKSSPKTRLLGAEQPPRTTGWEGGALKSVATKTRPRRRVSQRVPRSTTTTVVCLCLTIAEEVRPKRKSN